MKILSIPCVLVLFAFSIYFAFSGLWLSSFSIFITAILLFWTALCGIESLWKSSFSHILKALLLLCAFTNVINSNILSKPNYTRNNLDLFEKSIFMAPCSSEEQSDIKKRKLFNKYRQKLTLKCAMQPNTDLQKLALDLVKTEYQDPFTGAIDTIYNNIKKNKQLSCQELSTLMNSLCPGKLKL